MFFLDIAASCEFSYGPSGAVGYLYESVKDQMKWHKLSVKKYIKVVMGIGRIMVLSKEDYMKQKVENIKTPEVDMAGALKAAFGDGS
ncbi:MAG: hypothetical protein COA44_06200 [Arcobacter sp.]|nr:MAG: hypothetical protein COA44_06200 [Arcobacter sp.]